MTTCMENQQFKTPNDAPDISTDAFILYWPDVELQDHEFYTQPMSPLSKDETRRVMLQSESLLLLS